MNKFVKALPVVIAVAATAGCGGSSNSQPNSTATTAASAVVEASENTPSATTSAATTVASSNTVATSSYSPSIVPAPTTATTTPTAPTYPQNSPFTEGTGPKSALGLTEGTAANACYIVFHSEMMDYGMNIYPVPTNTMNGKLSADKKTWVFNFKYKDNDNGKGNTGGCKVTGTEQVVQTPVKVTANAEDGSPIQFIQ